MRNQGHSFRFRIETIASLALAITNRGRRFIGESRLIVPCRDLPDSDDSALWVKVDQCCRWAPCVLKHPSAREMTRNSFPFAVIDELQDCRGDELDFVKELYKCVPVVAAGDEFQDICGDGQSAPAMSWASGCFEVRDLGERSKRTDNHRILNTASALRGNASAPQPRVEAIIVPTDALAGTAIAMKVKSGWRGSAALVAYSPKQPFYRKTLQFLRTGNKSGKVGPLPFTFIEGESTSLDRLEVDVRKAMSGTSCGVDQPLPVGLPHEVVADWDTCKLRARRRGRNQWTQTDLLNESSRQAHIRRSFGSPLSGRIALSVHSAKNQEWSNVFVLWAQEMFGGKSNEEYRKRILYNAITRAGRNCCVIVRGRSRNEVLAQNPLFRELELREWNPPRKNFGDIELV